MRAYHVGVFPVNSRNGPKFTAFTRGYDPSWEGCCVHDVAAATATHATRSAVSEHRANCLPAGDALRSLRG